jgi:hypothetical protein
MIQRHEISNAVLNTDAAALNKYKMEKQLYRKVERLSKEVVEIKACLARVEEKLEKVENC